MNNMWEEMDEAGGDFRLVNCTTLIVDREGRAYEQDAREKKLIKNKDLAETIGNTIRCKNSENGICGQAKNCDLCEIHRGIALVLASRKKRSLSVVKELASGKNVLLDVDIMPFGSPETGQVFIAITERDSTYMKIFLEDRENYHYEDFFYTNLDKLNLLIWSCDLAGNIRNMSSSLLALLGITKDEMAAGKWREHVSADLTKISTTFTGDTGASEIETKIVDFEGEIRWLLVRITEHTDHEGRVDGYIGKCTDITALKIHQIRIDERIREAEVVKKNTDEFIAKLSHEVRTPLNGILGMTELLLRTKMDQEQTEDVGIIKNSALNMLRLVNDMLDMTRIEAGKISLVTTKMNLESVIKDILRAMETSAKNKNIQFLTQIDLDKKDVVIGDQDRIRQVLMNLVNNAVKFTNAGGTVTVRASASRTKIMEAGLYNYHFEVEDTGVGIPKDEFTRLFKNYSQLTSSLQGKNSGLGLGLAISKGLVELMGGEIWVKSKVGKGACFVFELPLMSNHSADALPVAEEPEKHVEEGVRALVAEDNEMNRFVIEKLLEGMKYEVEVVENGYEAMKAFINKAFDIIFMDVQMPIMDGLETTKKIREMENGLRHIPIIAVTAFAIKGDRERFIEAGMDGYISKPISLVELKEEVHKVEDLLKTQKHMNQENQYRKTPVPQLEEAENTSAVDEKVEIEKLMKGLLDALTAENEDTAENLIIQLKELASEHKDSELKDQILKVAMSFRAGNYPKAIDYIKNSEVKK